MNYDDLAYAIYGDIEPLSFLEEKYPKRNLEVPVTRFAPSPTGFLHTGSLFSALMNYHFAKQDNGIFYLRLEDTDTKREISNSKYEMVTELRKFGVEPNEGFLGEYEKGEYGPYVQSERKHIYDIVINDMIKKGRAYPCFCTQEALEKVREIQTKEKKRTGYYKEYATCRNLPIEEAIQRIKANEPYIIRFKSMGDFLNKIKVDDLIRGSLELSENDLDIVIRKSDGLPTYHFAHLVDDHFMHTTIVLRGEEWLPSLPIHLELFEAMGFEKPKYAHLPVIMKVDNGKRRKLSKRYDKEAAVSYFLESGYPVEAVILYLYTIANSNFEEWYQNGKDPSTFRMSFDKMSLDGALFDIEKINSISKEYLGNLSKKEIALRSTTWAKTYSPQLLDLINQDNAYYEEIMGLEREKENPRKDYITYGDIFPAIDYFYDDIFYELVKEFKVEVSEEEFNSYLESLSSKTEEEWLDFMKTKAKDFGYALSNKDFKANPTLYKGTFGAFMSNIRIVVTGKKVSQNLYYVGNIIGKEHLIKRFQKAIEIMSEK